MTSGKIIRLGDMDELDLRATSTHESGHFQVAEHFHLSPRVVIAGTRDGGVVHKPGTPLQAAAIAWAGALAEDLLNARSPRRILPSVQLNEQTLEAWTRESVRSGFPGLSSEDLAGVRSWPHNYLESARLAFSILSADLPTLKLTADFLLKASRQRACAALARGSPESDRAEVEAFLLQEQERHEAAAIAENTREVEEGLTLLAQTPRQFPAPLSRFWELVVSPTGRVTVEVVQEWNRFLLAKAHGRQDHADELTRFYACGLGEGAWRGLRLEFREWQIRLARQ